MQPTTIIKLVLMGVFFTQVLIFGRFISSLKCFHQGNIMAIAMTFSGTLFLSIALIDIIPQAIDSFDMYFSQNQSSIISSSSMHQSGNLPLTMIIATTTYMIIMYIDKILIGHSHDHSYQVSFINEPRKTTKNMIEEQLKDQNNNNKISGQKSNSQNQLNAQEKQPVNWKPFILQAGMTVGLQKTPLGVLSLASAIVVHKWAQGLTLGLIYQKQGFKTRTVNIMIIVQASINVLGLLTGTLLIGQGPFIMAFFMSIAAGTFLYISTAEVLLQQVQTMSWCKLVAMSIAVTFVTSLIFFQKMQEANASAFEGST